jgi:hypothetical protein
MRSRKQTARRRARRRAETIALSALAWVLADEARALRLLDLTGLTPDSCAAG